MTKKENTNIRNMKNEIDKKAYKILDKYAFEDDTSLWRHDDINYAITKGYWLTEPKEDSIPHSDFIKLLARVHVEMNKQKCTNLFLRSLTLSRPDYRVGLGVMAIMKTFPTHTFYNKEHNLEEEEYDKVKYVTTPCSICNDYMYQPSSLNSSLLYLMYLGGGKSLDLTNLYVGMLIDKRLEEETPTDEDIERFSAILDLVLSSEQKDTPTILRKRLTKSRLLHKEQTDQVQSFLGLLGYCGILHSDKHLGAFYEYRQLGCPPHKTHNSDWSYPVDFWLGEYGIDKVAFKYWFGEYKGLEKYWK